MRISDWSSNVCASDLPTTCTRAADGGLYFSSCRSRSRGADGHRTEGGWRPPEQKSPPNRYLRAVVRSGFPPAERASLSSEERRGGKACVRPCRSRWTPHHETNK